MSSVERGKRNISVLNLARIAAALDTSILELLGSREMPRMLIRTASAPVPPMARREDNRLKWTPGDYLSLG
jgi:transcriptional regulator with XRE-family HTH domain